MGIFTEKITNNSVFSDLDVLIVSLNRAKGMCQLDADLMDNWDRADAITQYALRVLNESDPLLLSLTTLNNLSTIFQQSNSELQAFVGNSNPAHWVNIQNNLDGAIYNLATIPQQTTAGVEEMLRISTNYRAAVNGLLESVNKEGENVRRMQSDLQSRISEAAAEVINQKQRIDNAIASFQQQFLEAQQARQNEYLAERERRDTVENESTDAWADAHSKLVGRLESKTDKLIGEIDERKQHAQKLVGIIANTGMAYGFQKTANDERLEANTWKKVAAAALVVWIVVGCVFFALTYDKDLTLAAVARQFLISTPFVLLSGFAALQVSRHQKNERSLRQAELEIASIDPFLSTLSDEDRNAVKREFATRYFGQRESEPKQKEASPSNLIELAGALSKAVQELAKKD